MANNNWGDIPTDIAAKIAQHLHSYDDYQAFGHVCSSWRFAIKKAPHKNNHLLPWLMLVDPDDSSYRRYYNLDKRMFLKIDLPSSFGEIDDDHTRRYFSSRGWLISMTQKNRRITLFNPFSKTVIELPKVPLDQIYLADGEWEPDWMFVPFFQKFVLSSSPSKAHDNDYIVAMIFDCHQLAFWRPGLDRWTELTPDHRCHDICFFRGEFYAIYSSGIVMALGDLNAQTTPPPRVVGNLGDLLGIIGLDHLYLVESESKSEYETFESESQGTSCLLVIHRKVFLSKKWKYKTTSFEAFKLDVDTGKVEQVKCLGRRAIFVGYNSTFSVQAPNDERGCRANCIYYTDDNYQIYCSDKKGQPSVGGSDMGIYNLESGRFLHFQYPYYEGPSRFSLINPPIWVEISDA